jgi:transposase
MVPAFQKDPGVPGPFVGRKRSEIHAAHAAAGHGRRRDAGATFSEGHELGAHLVAMVLLALAVAEQIGNVLAWTIAVGGIKGLCAVHGIYDHEPLRPNRLARLEQLRAADRRELLPRIKAEIERELQRLELVLNMIKTVEAERDAIASAGKSSTHANTKKIQDLIRLKSIGPEIGTTLVGEVFYRQFNNRQQLGSYVGLTPSHFQSGPLSRDQGISKAGNPKARTVMIELAWLWLRHPVL